MQAAQNSVPFLEHDKASFFFRYTVYLLKLQRIDKHTLNEQFKCNPFLIVSLFAKTPTM